ncbi:hypothetical protein EOS_27900 [Caballeronia mineralivorans PML1(12)]|uniref:Purine nucleoside phosphorylase n=1 Tax=Caballeronia mineralivorans PML1(12) TaxID=908627 RepID=A0A0J1CRL3_9BURK|nr:DUF4148 domain-containing protein [Caballeronia mineralivorans]KLU22956.1 hypothetical protein EOS_27900 [Caballeronia mineralivorans PML1(12)]
MKTLIYAVLAVALAAPVASFAQDANAPVTHAQVVADLVQLENVGYRPAADDIHYPAGIQAAEARVHPSVNDTNSYGGVAESGTSVSGPQSSVIPGHSIYYGH